MNNDRPSLSRRLALPAIVLLIAALFWWQDRKQNEGNKEPLDGPVPAPKSALEPQEFVGKPDIARWEPIEDFDKDIALFESVFWEPDDTKSLRQLIRDTDLTKNRSVLEIGTGSGLVSLVCLKAGASRVLATDINPAAVKNAVFNAKELGLLKTFEVRLVPRRDPSAWSVLKDNETFDLIISNPPWENSTPKKVAEFALYDPGFQLLKSLLSGAKNRLNPGGKMLLAYGCSTAIRTIEDLAPKHGLAVKRIDVRKLDDLPEVFLPGMLLELTVAGQ